MTKDEEILLRELAGGRCTIQKVRDALGPMSLWSKAGLEEEIRKAVEAEREACAKVCDVLSVHPEYASSITKLAAQAIRNRG